MMWKVGKKRVVEIFRIRAEGFGLWAVMVSLGDGRFLVRGWAKFRDGQGSYFHSDADDRASLSDQTMSVCRPIAAFYGAQVMHRKIEGSGKERDAHPLLAQQSQLVH